MKIPVKDLQKAYSLLCNVPELDEMESSRFIRCETTDSKMELHLASSLFGFSTVKIKEGKAPTFYLERTALGSFLKAASNDDLEVNTAGKLTLTQGKNKLELSAPAAVNGYATKPGGNPLSVVEFSEEEFGQVRTLQKYIPRKSVDLRYGALHGMKGYGWIATDSYTMAVHLDKKVPAVALPLELLLAAEGDPLFHLRKDNVSFVGQSGTLYHPMHADLALFQADKARKSVEECLAAKVDLTVERVAWVAALEYLGGFGAKAPVACEFKKGVALLSISATGVKADTRVPVKIKNPKVESGKSLRWNLESALPWAQTLSSETIQIAAQEWVTTFTSENRQDVLMLAALTV